MTRLVAELQKNCIYWQDRAVVLQDEIDRLRAEKALLLEELNEVRTIVPADFFDALDSLDDLPEPIAVRGWGEEVTIEFTADGHAKIGPPVLDDTGPIETMTVDITQDHDVRAKQRRLVELDYAGNVVVEYVEKRP